MDRRDLPPQTTTTTPRQTEPRRVGGNHDPRHYTHGINPRLNQTFSRPDGFSRLAYPEALEDEKAATTIAFFHPARLFFAAHGITRITRLATDNGANYSAKAFRRSTCAFISRRQRRRVYTPRHNGKIERYQRLMADEHLYARTYASEIERRNAISVWNHHYSPTLPAAVNPRPHATTPASTTS